MNLVARLTEDIRLALDTLEAAPGVVADLIADLSDENLRHRHSLEEFSALENVCHLRDIEIEGYTKRISRILSEDTPTLPDIDGGRLAVERDYNTQEVDEALEAFRRARQANVTTLRRADPGQLSRQGILAGVGTVTLGKLVSLMREHDESHNQDLRAIREKFNSRNLKK